MRQSMRVAMLAAAIALATPACADVKAKDMIGHCKAKDDACKFYLLGLIEMARTNQMARCLNESNIETAMKLFVKEANASPDESAVRAFFRVTLKCQSRAELVE